MGRRGPAPKPTALKLLNGNPGKRAINAEEPKLPALDIAKAPKGMTRRAKVEWDRLAPDLVTAGVLTVADVDTFRTYCELVARVEQYEKQIKRVGITDAHSLGYANYLIKLQLQKKQYAETLGLTPSARSRVKSATKKDPADPDEAFLFGKRGA